MQHLKVKEIETILEYLRKEYCNHKDTSEFKCSISGSHHHHPFFIVPPAPNSSLGFNIVSPEAGFPSTHSNKYEVRFLK